MLKLLVKETPKLQYVKPENVVNLLQANFVQAELSSLNIDAYAPNLDIK